MFGFRLQPKRARLSARPHGDFAVSGSVAAGVAFPRGGNSDVRHDIDRCATEARYAKHLADLIVVIKIDAPDEQGVDHLVEGRR